MGHWHWWFRRLSSLPTVSVLYLGFSTHHVRMSRLQRFPDYSFYTQYLSGVATIQARNSGGRIQRFPDYSSYLEFIAGRTYVRARRAATAAVRPGAPTGASATVVDQTIQVSFTAPTNTGSSPITSYTVRSSPGGITASGASSPITVNGLTAGTNYTFTVVATNSAGSSVASAPTASVSIPVEPPNPLFTIDPASPGIFDPSTNAIFPIGGPPGSLNNVTYTPNISGPASFNFTGNSSMNFYSNYNFGSRFSVVGWIKPSIDGSGNTFNTLIANDTFQTLEGFKLGWSNLRLKFQGAGVSIDTGIDSISYGTWQQIGFTLDIPAQTVEFYYDGYRSGPQGILPVGLSTYTNNGFSIGSSVGGPDGIISSLGIFKSLDSALTEEQILQLWNETRGQYGR